MAGVRPSPGSRRDRVEIGSFTSATIFLLVATAVLAGAIGGAVVLDDGALTSVLAGVFGLATSHLARDITSIL